LVWTREIWYYDLRTNKHFALKQRPLTREDLDDFVSCFHSADRSNRVESERFKRFTYAEVLARDKIDLDITWLRDDSDTDASLPPDPEMLIAEIIEELTVAANELAEAASTICST
jgi:type I restriction enzyme M protein